VWSRKGQEAEAVQLGPWNREPDVVVVYLIKRAEEVGERVENQTSDSPIEASSPLGWTPRSLILCPLLDFLDREGAGSRWAEEGVRA
jgi:hypothetical protein